jgi:hypothetical protein
VQSLVEETRSNHHPRLPGLRLHPHLLCSLGDYCASRPPIRLLSLGAHKLHNQPTRRHDGNISGRQEVTFAYKDPSVPRFFPICSQINPIFRGSLLPREGFSRDLYLSYFPPPLCLLILPQHVLQMDLLKGMSANISISYYILVSTYIKNHSTPAQCSKLITIVRRTLRPTPPPAEAAIPLLPMHSDSSILKESMPTSPTLMTLSSFIAIHLPSRASKYILHTYKRCLTILM